MSPNSQKRRRNSQAMTCQLLRSLCQFPEPDFLQFKKEMMVYTADLKNRIGSGGAATGKELAITEAQREEWLNAFIDSGIGVRYWGPGTARKWDFETGQEQIRAFMAEMFKYTSTILNNKAHSKTQVGKPSPEAAKRSRTVTGKPSNNVANTVIDLEAELEKQGGLSFTTTPVFQQPKREFVLESTLAGSTNPIRLIYSTDVPTLAHLLEQVRRKHDLGRRQEIFRICAKIKGRYLNVDLEEHRDWVHIAQVISDSGATPELIVWAT